MTRIMCTVDVVVEILALCVFLFLKGYVSARINSGNNAPTSGKKIW